MFQTGIRHSKRYQQIINTFIKNGLSHLLYRIGITGNKKVLPDDEHKDINENLMNLGAKLRVSLQELGPTFIKLGQIASARRDIVPEEIGKELEKLQDDVQGFSMEEVEEIFHDEFGKTTGEMLDDFITEPLATASIGQVHRAYLPTGEEVAIKIQRPNIKETMETDLDILFHIARLIQNKTQWGKTYRILDVIEDFSTSLRNELDYIVEGRNADRINKQFVEKDSIHIPVIYWDYTTQKILTMEMVHGIKVNQIEQLDQEGYDRSLIAERIAHSLFTQVLDDGFFHGDPHPGNIFIMPDNVVSFLDFGMVGRLSDQLKHHFASLLLAVQQNSAEKMIETFEDMDLLDHVENRKALHQDLEKLLTTYYDASLTDISLGQLLIDIFTIAYRHKVEIPTDIAVLAKAILTAEQIVEQLDPTFSIMKAVEPFGEKIIKERYHPRTLLKRALKEAIEDFDTLRELPKNIHHMTKTIGKGRLKFDLNVEDAPSFLKRLDRISNRLSFSIILLAFSILMAGLIIGASIAGESNLLFRLPIIELGGIVAIIMFLFMLFSIFRSGRM